MKPLLTILILLTACQSVSNIDTDTDTIPLSIHTKYEYVDYDTDRYVVKMDIINSTDFALFTISDTDIISNYESEYTDSNSIPDFTSMRMGLSIYYCYELPAVEGLTGLSVCKKGVDNGREWEYR